MKTLSSSSFIWLSSLTLVAFGLLETRMIIMSGDDDDDPVFMGGNLNDAAVMRPDGDNLIGIGIAFRFEIDDPFLAPNSELSTERFPWEWRLTFPGPAG